MRKVTTIFLNSNSSNPLAVEISIIGEKENMQWSWSYDINRIELVIGDKEGIDITKQVNNRALALITSQIDDEQDQIIEALEENKAPNKDSLFEMACNITRQHAKIHYGIDLNH